MARKITKEEFEQRFKNISPDRKFKVLEYTAISKPCVIKCLKCGKIHNYKDGNQALGKHFCCESETRLDSIIARLNQSEEYNYVKQVDKDNIVIRHNICGNEQTRNILSAYKEPCSCSYCNTIKKKNMLTIEQAQAQLDETFHYSIQLLEYNGQFEDKKNKYKCLKCGLIFEQKQVCLLASRGCPKCDRWKSKGEKQIAHYLLEKNIEFKEQVRVPELNAQSFDFCIYKNGEIIGFIECQGEQHFENREIFKDSLKKIQERDNRKRKYCQDNNIPLYEIIYRKGKLLNMEILPF